MLKRRQVICDDAVKWLNESDEHFTGSVFTGIPDMYDVYDFNSTQEVGIYQRSIDYKDWFISVTDRIFSRLPPGQCAIFSQTDAKIVDPGGNLINWIDKSTLCQISAAKSGCILLWHKIALDPRAEISSHRPCYTHLLCFSKERQYHVSQFRTPDVINRGKMTWEKATGLEACILCVSFLKTVIDAPLVINPFCGRGTILAVCDYFDLPSLGIEVLAKRARRALKRDLRGDIAAIPDTLMRMLTGLSEQEEFGDTGPDTHSSITGPEEGRDEEGEGEEGGEGDEDISLDSLFH